MQDAPVPKVTPSTRSSQGRARLCRVSHGELTYTNLTPKEMDPMTRMLQSLDS